MRFLRDLGADVRYGARLLRRSPGFTAVAVGSLALGIAGATAVFTLLNAIVLRPLPVSHPRELYYVNVTALRDHGDLLSARALEDARAALNGRAELCAATGVSGMQLWPAGEGAASRGLVQLVSGEYFSVLRQRPALGRLLQPSDNLHVDAHPVAVISDAYWHAHFDAAPEVVGRTVSINGTPFTIVGVTAPGFFGTTVGTRYPDAWIPFMMQPAVRYQANASNSGGDATKPWPTEPKIAWLNVFVRVPAGTPPAQIASALSLVAERDALALLGPDASADSKARASAANVTLESAANGISNLRQDAETPLVVLLAMVGVLLAIACGNVAGLMLSRAVTRVREVSIRLSIGARRSRIVRQMLAESLLLGATAGAIGLAVAVWVHEPLLRLFVPGATVIDLDTGMDWRVLGFGAAVSMLAGLACGVVPAIRGTNVPLTESLKQTARSVGGGSRGLFAGKTLVAAQMAFCLLLLVVAGLFARSLQSLTRVDVGYDEAHLLVAGLDSRSAGIQPSERVAVYERIIDRVRQVPGVESVSLSANGPQNNSSWRSSLAVEGYTAGPDERLRTNEEIVVGPYFKTVGLRVVEGRPFESQDRRPETRATIINQTMARRFFKGTSAIGKRWTYGDPIDDKAFTIVGVVEDARYLNVRTAVPNMAYHPAEFDLNEVVHDLEVRTSGSPAALAGAVRQAIREAEPRLPITEVVPFSDRVARGLSRDRLVAGLSSAFSGLALLLACLGLYGTISYGISRRIAEIGLRIALGAERGTVLGMVMREALLLVAAGGLAGLALAVVAARSLNALLFGVPPADFVSFGFAIAVLVVVAAFAAFLPAHRASRIAPIVALNR
jgi:predicted permease